MEDSRFNILCKVLRISTNITDMLEQIWNEFPNPLSNSCVCFCLQPKAFLIETNSLSESTNGAALWKENYVNVLRVEM